MGNTYIKFKSPKTGIGKKPENIGKKIAKVIFTTIVPVANPDFENKIDEVSTWLIEFEADSYYPNREVGLDISDTPIIIMPWQRNYGYWTDNNLTIENFRSHFKTVDISKEEFERNWKLFEEKH